MDGNKVLGLGPGLCVFKEERPWPVVPRTDPRLDDVREPARLDATSSWVTVECVDDSDAHKPVSGVQLEIITRAGLVYTRNTDEKGVVFLNGIAPGGVTIRVLGMDESMWWPFEGDQSEATPSDERPRWHEVKRGDSLSKIARQYGVKSWEAVWHHAKNQELREKRKSPHVLHVGDFVAVPPTMIGAIRRDTETTHRLVMKRRRVRRGYMLESQDLRFSAGSCVLLAGPDASHACCGLDALATTLRHAQEHPAQRLLLAGHSDIKEAPESELSLSESRAKATAGLLRGQQQPWISEVTRHNSEQDLSAILRWAAATWGFPCAPRDDDPEHERALRALQHAYNEAHDADIAEDGVLGRETWGAVFDLCQYALAERLETDMEGLKALQGSLTFCSTDIHPCGGALAVQAGVSADSEDLTQYRRADVLFFEEGQEPRPIDLQAGPLTASEYRLEPVAVREGPRSKLRESVFVITPYTTVDVEQGADADFTLSGPRYARTLTVSEHCTRVEDYLGTKYVQLEFEHVPNQDPYTLVVNPKGGDEYVVFDGISFSELVDDGHLEEDR